MVWMRKDGQPVDARFHGAIGQCREVAAQVGAVSPGPQRQELMVAAMEGCMARRGYKWGCRHSLANPLDGECLVNLPAT
jgi:alcohol dehydrogenase class IV